MKFISLTKYFYQHTQEEYETEYIRRLEAPFTVHFNIPIHQYHRKTHTLHFSAIRGKSSGLLKSFIKPMNNFFIQ